MVAVVGLNLEGTELILRSATKTWKITIDDNGDFQKEDITE